MGLESRGRPGVDALPCTGGAEIRRTLDRVRGVLASARSCCARATERLERARGSLRAAEAIVRAHRVEPSDPCPPFPAALAPAALEPELVAVALAEAWDALEAAARAQGAPADTDDGSGDALERAFEACVARAMRAMGETERRALAAALQRLARSLGVLPACDGPRRGRFRPPLRA